MTFCSWNVRGLRGDGKMRMVKDLKNKFNLSMLGLIETKRQVVTRLDVNRIWGGSGTGWEYVGSDGASGRLLMIWDDTFFHMNNCYKGERWLCVKGVVLKNSFNCAFLLIYDAHSREEKSQMWEELSYIDGRLDRVLVSVEWLEEFFETRLQEGPRGLSDHCPIIVEDRRMKGGPRPFRSLDAWFTHDGFLRMVKEEWRGLGELQFTDKLKALTGLLRSWHKNNFGDMNNKILKLEEEIKKVDDMASAGVYDAIMEARRKALVTCCERWYVRKEIHWKQMSRSQQAKEMDRNTRYFHNIASSRRRNNRIDNLVVNGRLIRNQARIKVAIRDFYKDLYHQESSPLLGFKDGMVRRIDEEESRSLEVMPSAEEIRQAVGL
ncbi:uncharacterized protein LOC130957577 [Arachis stenosperma]|uniref:uncharacterized protein LOC130957577 n=1 Tax=Arachis stenosperma TaxID=217475 RepID=UPI0025AC26E0|nr:uncharacterized protein LOC130957577 [Arachis stenosperma]